MTEHKHPAIGDVYRHRHAYPFSDMVVTRFEVVGGDMYVTCERPYAYASEAAGRAHIGIEAVTMLRPDALRDHYVLVDTDRVC